MNLKTPSRKRLRTCFDRLRARMITARRARRANPAASAAAQLLAIFTALVGRMPLTPPAPVRYIAPSVSPAWAERKQLAQGLGVPVRYVEIIMARGEVPYSVLFHHIRGGGVLRRDAMRVLRTRAPEASIDWLDTPSSRGDIAGPAETGTGIGSSLASSPSGKYSDPTNDEGGPKGRRP